MLKASHSFMSKMLESGVAKGANKFFTNPVAQGVGSLVEAAGTKTGMLGLAALTGIGTVGSEIGKSVATTDVQTVEDLRGLKTAMDMPGNIGIGAVLGGGIAGGAARMMGGKSPFFALAGAAIGAGLGAASAGSMGMPVLNNIPYVEERGMMNFALRSKAVDPAQDMSGPEMAGALQAKIDGPMMFGKGTPRNYSLGAKGDLTLALHHKRHG